MVSARVTSNGAIVVKGLEKTVERTLDLQVPMTIAAEEIYLAARNAIDNAESPDGSKWAPLSPVTIALRKRGGNVLPLQGDTNQLVGSMFARGEKNRAVFGSKASSRKGFPYWLSQLFGAKRKGEYKQTRYESAEGEERLIGPIQNFTTRQRSGTARRIHSKGDAFEKITPPRPFFPVFRDASGKLALMGGNATALFDEIKNLIREYIANGEANG